MQQTLLLGFQTTAQLGGPYSSTNTVVMTLNLFFSPCQVHPSPIHKWRIFDNFGPGTPGRAESVQSFFPSVQSEQFFARKEEVTFPVI